ncbi:hypothetical protein O1611_g5447 [Lasiodiplodia mahajangana]|uniref:Uncharacterized protein n=1 Tax=Lasiodiplodia mahajangana TaxID=1108764 RepID=A0ACC2JLB8_9PEZI|nr:hypothetical protein O1611_g5447 [Lasiodiplodia mahajangana]
MRASTSASLLLYASAYLAPASAHLLPSRRDLDLRLEGKRAAHVVGTMELDGDLEKRRVVDYCVADPARSGVCVALSGVVSAVAFGIASILKSDSDANDCTAHSGQVDDIHWSVFANGSHCDTTAELGTIAGAMANYLRTQNQSLCGVHCIKMTHGGTWQGYVTLGPAGEPLDNYYCGSAYSFGDCGSGGKSDA